MTDQTPVSETLPADEESLANFMYSIRSYDEAEAKAKLLFPLLSHAQTPAVPRIAERLADVITMLDTPDAYNREYIAAVCRSILSSLADTSTDRCAKCGIAFKPDDDVFATHLRTVHMRCPDTSTDPNAGLPTHDDVRGILSDTTPVGDSQ